MRVEKVLAWRRTAMNTYAIDLGEHVAPLADRQE
jgi:hypothetical protein